MATNPLTDDDPGMAVEKFLSSDVGVSTADAQAMKQCILKSVQEGFVEAGDVATLANDLIDAFKEIDEQVFIRSELEKALTSAKK